MKTALPVAGAVLGGITLKLEGDLNARRIDAGDELDQFTASLNADADRIDSMALASDILLAVGGAAVVSALLLYVLRTRSYERDASEDELALSIGAGGLALRGSF